MCAGRLQSSSGVGPELGGAASEREAAAGVSGEGDRTHTEQGKSRHCSFSIWWREQHSLVLEIMLCYANRLYHF